MTSINNLTNKTCDAHVFRDTLINLVKHNLETSDIEINQCEKAVIWLHEIDFSFKS